jgi:membrane protease YdiL (CAAX protease family)
MAATSGFCEEFVFRGYFLKQFSAWTASVPIGVTLQAVLFGAAHPLLGAKQMIVIIVSGVLFGVLALWRNSLRPGMVAHAWADIFGGIILHGLPYK